MDDVIELVHKNQKTRERVPVVLMKEDQARDLLIKGAENKNLRQKISQGQRENLAMKIFILACSAIIVLACIIGSYAEAVNPAFAWLMAMPSVVAAILCCLPRDKQEEGRC